MRIGVRRVGGSHGTTLLLFPPAPSECRPRSIARAARRWYWRGGRIVAGTSSLGALSDARGGVMSELLLDAGRRRSPATLPEFHAGPPPRKQGDALPRRSADDRGDRRRHAGC